MNYKHLFIGLFVTFQYYLLSANTQNSGKIQHQLQALSQQIQTAEISNTAILEKLEFLSQQAAVKDNIEVKGKLAKLWGDFYLRTKQIDEAESAYLESIRLMSAVRDSSLLSAAYFGIGQICNFKDHHSAATYFAQNARNYHSQIDKQDQFKHLILLGKSFLEEKNYESAIKSFEEAQLLADYLSPEAMTTVKLYLLKASLLKGTFTDKDHLESLRQTVMSQLDNRNKVLYFQIRSQYLMPINVLEATKELRISNVLIDDAEIEFVVENKYLEAELALMLGEIERATTLVDEAKSICDASGFFRRTFRYYQLKNGIYLKTNQPKKAQLFMQQIKTLKQDEINHLQYLLQQINNPTVLQVKPEHVVNTNWYLMAMSILLIVLFATIYGVWYLKRKERVQQRQKQMLEKANEDLESTIALNKHFVNDITIEIRMPLMVIKTLSSLLKKNVDSIKSAEYLELLEFTNNYLARYVKYVSLAKKVKKSILAEEVFDFKLIVFQMCSIFKIFAEDKKFSFVYDHKLPEKVIGDPLRFIQLLFNIMHIGELKLDQGNLLSIRLIHTKGADILVGVQFQTPTKLLKDTVLKAFNENKPSSDPVVEKLFSLKKQLDVLHGELLPVTRLEGDIFEMQIPFKKAMVKPENKIDVQQRVSNTNGATLDTFTVLLVEDNKINQLIMQKLIKTNGFSCETADNGKEAVEKVQNKNYGLILMDMMMPVMGGVEAIQKIRTFNNDVSIVALSAVSKASMAKDLQGIKVDKMLCKPIEPEQLFEIIKQYAYNVQHSV